MATLTGQTIAATYDALLKVTDNGPITSSLKLITDGLGNNTALSLSSVAASITGTLSVTSTIGASNLSGTNTGDETNATIKTKLGAASASQDGYLTSTDWSTFNSKQSALGYTPVPNTRTLTINGTSYDLSADRSWTISAGISGSGTTNYLSKFTSSSAIGNSLVYDDGNSVLINGTFNIASTYKLQVTGDIYTSGNLGIGIASVTTKLLGIGSAITGGTTAYGITFEGNISSGVTTNGIVYRSYPIVTGGSLGAITHYIASKNAFIGGSTVTNQYGFFADASVNGATNNYGFYGNIASDTGRWNLYMNGTAQNYINGNLGIGVAVPTVKLDVSGAGLFSSSVTASSFIKSGGTSAQLLAGDGSVVTAGTNITISGGTISSSGGLSGSGTTNYVPKFTSSSAIGNSQIFDNGTNVGIGTASPNRLLTLAGTTSGYIALNASSHRNTTIGSDSVGSFIVYDDTASAYRMVINSAGNIGIGTISPNSNGGSAAKVLHINSSGIGDWAVTHYTNGSTGNAAVDGLIVGNIGADSYIFNYESGALILATSSVERMRITSGGNVGIGTSSPASRLSVWNGEITISNLDASYTVPMGSIGAYNANANTGGLVFKTSNSGTNAEKVRITSDGFVGIGTSSPATLLDINSSTLNDRLTLSHSGSLKAGFGVTSTGITYIYHHPSATFPMWISATGNVGIGNTSPTAKLSVAGDITVLSTGAAIAGSTESIYFAGTSNGNYLAFGTNSNERARIANDGRFQVNNTGYSSNCTATLRALTGTATDRILECITIGYSSAFYVQTNGNYFFAGSNLSDARTKKDINYFNESILDKVMKLKPASFRYKENEENIKGGFIAQDIKEIFPDLVTATKSDDEMMGVDYYGVIAILTKAIQELKLEVEELKNK